MFGNSSPWNGAGLGGSMSKGMDFAVLMKNNDISSEVQRYLADVFGILCLCLVFFGLGVTVNLWTGIGGLFSILLSFGLVVYIGYDPDKSYSLRRISLVCLFGVLQGMSLGPLIGLAILVDPNILLSAICCTTLIFGSFAASALVAKRRSWLFLGGVLGSCFSMLFALSLINLFFPMAGFQSIQLYGGLVVFSLFVVFDTQLIIERASSGLRDVAGDAITLFMDFINIFIRVLIILLKKGKRSDGESSRDSGDILPRFRRGDPFDL